MNRKEFAIIALIILLTVVAWIAFSIYHTNITPTISQKDLKQVEPLNPKLDTDLIEKLKKRED